MPDGNITVLLNIMAYQHNFSLTQVIVLYRVQQMKLDKY